MIDSKRKSEILAEEGFLFHFRREIYINGEKRKIFSVEAISDHPVDWLKNNINEPSIPDGWQFYFNGIPSNEIKQDILNEIAPG